ncbi:ROK family protein [Streptomyces sp. NPDC051567]|uniref:ROK family protein n=1 Tax=Streptomyces sp. NPDC051567 TaxID=3365660 RepID=UPI00378E4D47
MVEEAIGIDVGGTKTLALRVRPDGTVTARVREPTPRTGSRALLLLLAGLADRLRTPVTSAVGVALPGLVETTTGVLRHAPGFRCDDLAVGGLMEEATGLPVRTDNDARAAAWAEYRVGAGRGHDDVVVITAGTGWGCGVVIGGRLLRGTHGFACEVGHLFVDPQGPACYCGRHGCAEVSASGGAISHHGRAAGFADGESVTRAAHDGDREALRILRTVGTALGRGAATLVDLLDPAVVIVGGGAAEAGDLLLAPARTAMREALTASRRRPHIPPVVTAALGNDAGATGIALLALDPRPPQPRD